MLKRTHLTLTAKSSVFLSTLVENSHYIFQALVVGLAPVFEEQLGPGVVPLVSGPDLKRGQVPALAPVSADRARVFVSGAGVLVIEVVLLPLCGEQDHLPFFGVLNLPSVLCKSFKVGGFCFVFNCA